MKVVIVSGFFNPLHGGHLDMIEAAAKMGDRLLVIVNNDEQQIEKKGKIILDEQNRARLMRALRDVDEVIIGIDPAGNHWPSTKTLEFPSRHSAKRKSLRKKAFSYDGFRDEELSGIITL
jgi:cytidyltransferase-like protein